MDDVFLLIFYHVPPLQTNTKKKPTTYIPGLKRNVRGFDFMGMFYLF